VPLCSATSPHVLIHIIIRRLPQANRPSLCPADHPPVREAATHRSLKRPLQEPGEDEEGPGAGETFDDSSFYSRLLREFLEQSMGAGGAAQAALNSAKGVKKRKSVDRRASKSRRLRWGTRALVAGVGLWGRALFTHGEYLDGGHKRAGAPRSGCGNRCALTSSPLLLLAHELRSPVLTVCIFPSWRHLLL